MATLKTTLVSKCGDKVKLSVASIHEADQKCLIFMHSTLGKMCLVLTRDEVNHLKIEQVKLKHKMYKNSIIYYYRILVSS